MPWFASRRSKIQSHQKSTLARHHRSSSSKSTTGGPASSVARERWLEGLFHEHEVLLEETMRRGVLYVGGFSPLSSLMITRLTRLTNSTCFFCLSSSRLPKTSLLLLTLTTLFIHLISTRTPLLPVHLIGQTGATMTAALSMTTGLLMSYRSSTALAKWGKGKGVWGGVKGEVRDVLRQVGRDFEVCLVRWDG